MADCLNVRAVGNERICVTLDKLCVWCTERCKQVGVAADKIGEVSVICIAAGSRDRKVRNVQQS